jgi:Domain of unknown function (DUF4157)
MERVAETAKQHEPSPAIAGHGRAASPADVSLPPALELQQLAGNQAMQQLLRSGFLQAKLAISNPDDPEEREADHVASTIMRKHAGAPCSCSPGEVMCEECQQKQSQPTISRRASAPAAPSHVPRIVSDVLRSPGHPLDSAARAFFEPRFGHDFSHVRVHTDSHAADSARSINAHAYTSGSDIVFAPGQYSPATETGRSLLAHELAHVIQQSGSQPPVLARQQEDEENTSTGPKDAGLPGGVSTPPAPDDSALDSSAATNQVGDPCLSDCERKFNECLNPPWWQFWKKPDPNQCLAEREACLRDCPGASKGRWSCEASCNVEGSEPQCTGRVTGSSSGHSSEEEACREAKRDATQKAPRGCYARHCRCFNCTNR